MSNPYQPIMQTGWVGDPAEAVTHIYRMQDKRDPFRYMDFDPRAWNFIVVPINPDEAVVGYTNADQPNAARKTVWKPYDALADDLAAAQEELRKCQQDAISLQTQVIQADQRGDDAMRRLRAAEKLLLELRPALASMRFYVGATNDNLIDQLDFYIEDLRERSALRFDDFLTTPETVSEVKK